MLLPRIGIASRGCRNRGLRHAEELFGQIDGDVVHEFTKSEIEGHGRILRVQDGPGKRRTNSHQDTSPAAGETPEPAAGLTERAPESHNPVKAAEGGHLGPPSASSNCSQQRWTHS